MGLHTLCVFNLLFDAEPPGWFKGIPVNFTVCAKQRPARLPTTTAGGKNLASLPEVVAKASSLA
jgi:hypothetical protein